MDPIGRVPFALLMCTSTCVHIGLHSTVMRTRLSAIDLKWEESVCITEHHSYLESKDSENQTFKIGTSFNTLFAGNLLSEYF